jgi:hypothetical protein
MNYIPGFSNYLETSVPRYANGGPVAGDVVLTPEQRAARRAAANTPPPGTSITGPTAGEKPLSFGTDNTFNVGEGQEVRVVDAGGNVIFSGFGAEGAKRAVAVGQSLSDDLGKNANFKIQKGERTINPDGSVGGNRYIDVARAAPSQTGLGFLADYVLPFAATFIPGVGPVLGAALGSAASSGLQGRSLQDALVRAAIAGGTAGIASGTGLDKAIGGALSNTGGQAAGQVAGQVAGQAAGSAGGDIVVSGLTKALQSAGGALGSAALSQAGNAASRELSGYKTPAEKFVEQPSQIADPLAVVPEVPYDGIKVIGPKLVSGSGLPFGAAFSVPVNEMLSGALTAAQPTPAEQPKTAEEIEAEKNPMVVTGPKNLLPADFATSAAAAAAANAANGMADAPDRAEMTDEDLDAYMNDVSKGGGLGSLLSDMTLAQKVNLLGLGVGAAGSLAGGGGGGGSGQAGTYIPGGAGSGRLNPIFSAQLPAAGALGTVGATRTARPLGDQDWLTYGTRPELKFFDYSTTPANPAPVTSPVPGNPAGPIMAEDKIRHSEEGIPLWMQLGLPNPNAPVTQPGAAGQIMQERDPTAMFEGGALDAASDKPSKRNEFAVNGPGTGRSDDIPAVLSDGEYVIDAETVALLGDGSSKAGAKKLDELRVKVRKHKGKKLAKGRFSANAKKPEAYLSGGRI